MQFVGQLAGTFKFEKYLGGKTSTGPGRNSLPNGRQGNKITEKKSFPLDNGIISDKKLLELYSKV